ncbi:MAG: hypothetical protein HY602_01245 [Parcubacteria group bacterium]|nr:hypothetical protein [Parcubacteria group bacterium]
MKRDKIETVKKLLALMENEQKEAEEAPLSKVARFLMKALDDGLITFNGYEIAPAEHSDGTKFLTAVFRPHGENFEQGVDTLEGMGFRYEVLDEDYAEWRLYL